jgi:outer membrane protein OmpA-like peptidoglycan-associated protein
MRKRDNPSSLNYFISYTDLLVGMLFLFIILLMAFALSFRGAQRQLEDRLDDIERRVDIRSELLDRIATRLRQGGVTQVQVDHEQGVLRFGEAVLFEPGKAELGADARHALDLLARELMRELPCYGSGRHGRCPQTSEPILEAVYIEGHTDYRNIRNRQFPTNWHLSSARAYETYRYLAEAAPALRSVPNSSGTILLSASAYADQRPVKSRERLDENRRIDIRFLLAPPTRAQVDASRAGR